MCTVLEVSESGYYRFLKSRTKPGRKAVLSAAIKDIYEEHPYNDNYGIERIRLALEQRGIVAGKRRITTIMRENGWIHRRRVPHGITKATTEAQEAENLIKQDFTAEEPFTKLLTDITEVQCADGKLYISPILDCYSGEILSLAMDNNMKKELCIRTVNAAAERYPIKNAILHNDRGSQYTSEAFKNKLNTFGITHSLSGVAHCYDNARMESFFATLKKELIYRLPVYRMSREKVKSLVFRYVFVYYNQIRVYTSNPGGLPPAVYRRLAYERYDNRAA